MFLGSFSASLFPLVSFFSAASSIILVYWISQELGQEKPFPHTWISATAGHYPGYIIFRMGTIMGAVFIMLSHLMGYFWLLQTSYDCVCNIHSLQPGFGCVLGIAGAMFLTASTALIDTGKHSTQWHVFCAVTFFILSVLSVWYHTLVSIYLRVVAKGGSLISVAIKSFLSLLLVFQVALQILYASENTDRLNNTIGNILEYTITFSILSFFLVWGWDLRKYKMGYIYKKWFIIPLIYFISLLLKFELMLHHLWIDIFTCELGWLLCLLFLSYFCLWCICARKQKCL